jgi:hypothetical protein
MKDEKILLPNRKEMLQRLMNVNSSTHLLEDFYPTILKNAGQEKTVKDLIVIILTAIDIYSENLATIAKDFILEQLPRFVEVLIDDKELAQKAKLYLQISYCFV